MIKIRDGILGFVVGDAIGVPIEFYDRNKLMENPVKDMLGYGTHNVPKGTWSDDTSMTLAFMDSIIDKNEIDYDDIMEKFLKWVNKAEYTATGIVFDIGGTCLRSIRNYQLGMLPLECGQGSIKTNGNGSLMRILPLAYYIYYKNIRGESKIIELVNNVSGLTHNHDISKLGCYIYVKYVLFLLDGYDKYESYKLIQKLDYSMYESRRVYSRILDSDISKLDIDDVSSSGYVVDTLESVLWVLLNTDNYKDAIIKAINLGNDTDTVGAICGSLAGIIYGGENIPTKWINLIIRKEYLFEIIYKFEKLLEN